LKPSGIYLLQRLYPNTNGGTLHNYGLMTYISKYVDLHVFSCLEEKYSYDMARVPFANNDFKVSFYHTYGRVKSKIYSKLHLIAPVDIRLLHDLEEEIRRNSTSVLFYVIRMYAYVRILQREFPQVRFVYISHNSEYANIYDDLNKYDSSHEVTGLRHKFKLCRAKGFTAVEKQCCTSSDVVFSISNGDTRRLCQKYQLNPSRFVLSKPMIPYTNLRSANAYRNEYFRHRLLIVGNMGWYPTADGAMWFADKVYPNIKRTDPEAELYIVGADPSPELQALGNEYPDTHVTGFVNSIDDYYRDCDIAIVPIFSGTGAKIKMLEAVGKGIPCVASCYAADDYEGMNTAVLTAQDRNVNEFTHTVLRLLLDENERKEAVLRESAYYQDYMSDSLPVREYLVKL
jgi:hypothetical protein